MRRALLAIALLAACDGPLTIITHVDRDPSFHGSQLQVMAGAAFPVEVHGDPLEGLSGEEAVRLLRMPQGSAQEQGFAPVPPGAEVRFRLVLHFNASGPPNARHDCARTAPASTGTPGPRGFMVNATFCNRDKWLAHGYMRAPEIESADTEDVTRAFRQLFMAILREEKDR